MEELDFTHAGHTIVLSDIHLADAEVVDPARPLWKRYKFPEHFIDSSFKEFLDCMSSHAGESIELVLNGDIFDFDSMMKIPDDPSFHVSWLEKLRGLSSEEPKSRFKIKGILESHPVWIQAIREFILAGNRVIFVIGNHDMELHWASVRQDIVDYLNLPEEFQKMVRFCEWFYISNQDTLIEHGNQYDAYCLCANPIHPLIHKGNRTTVRLPFGNLAGKYMTNGMGLMNPHANSSYIKSSAREYIAFYFNHVMKTQPLFPWTWFWSAIVTLVDSLTEGFLPSVKDPLTMDNRITGIAKRANASLGVVLSLKEVHVHPAIFDPWKIFRELWLDRVVILSCMFLGSFQFFSFMNVFANVSWLWFVFPLLILFPAFFFYARSVQSEVDAVQQAAFHMAPMSAKITHVNRIVQGHTHLESHNVIGGVEVLNTGTWSPAFQDIACTLPYGRKCFAWIRPQANSAVRKADLYEWKGAAAFELIQPT